MAGLLFTILVVGITLTVVLWVGTVFLQGYFYTEPTTGISWQAPAAGGVLTLFYLLWCLMNYNAEGASPTNLPYGSLLHPTSFSAKDQKGKKPVARLWAIMKNGQKVPYKRKAEPDRVTGTASYNYYEELPDKSEGSPYNGRGVVAVEIEEDGQKVRYEAQKPQSSDRRDFVSEEGWVIAEYTSGRTWITGEPTIFRTGRFLLVLLLDLLHLGLWFVCLWLLLRFTWGHALGLGFVLWLTMTLLVVSMLLGRAGAAAQADATPQRSAGLAPQPEARMCMMSPSCTT